MEEKKRIIVFFVVSIFFKGGQYMCRISFIIVSTVPHLT
jgi:hypothetical protein